MQYLKGTIALSEIRDYPLLRRVLHCGLVTSSQLYEFMKLDYCASSRGAFDDRLKRLMDHGMICRHDVRIVNRGCVYSLSRAGASELIGRGEFCTRQPQRIAGLRAHHALELNEIHLALKRTGMLVRWTSESEIRSRNKLSSRGYVKYYDAIITVRVDGQECCFALEYERTPKDKRRYQAIRERIELETRVQHFLYLLPSYDLLQYVMRCLSPCKETIHFGLSRDFLIETLNLQVQSTQSPISMMLRTVLSQGRLLGTDSSAPA